MDNLDGEQQIIINQLKFESSKIHILMILKGNRHGVSAFHRSLEGIIVTALKRRSGETMKKIMQMTLEYQWSTIWKRT